MTIRPGSLATFCLVACDEDLVPVNCLAAVLRGWFEDEANSWASTMPGSGRRWQPFAHRLVGASDEPAADGSDRPCGLRCALFDQGPLVEHLHGPGDHAGVIELVDGQGLPPPRARMSGSLLTVRACCVPVKCRPARSGLPRQQPATSSTRGRRSTPRTSPFPEIESTIEVLFLGPDQLPPPEIEQ